MHRLRRLLLRHRLLSVVILASALLMKVAVPSGLMLAVEHGRITVMVCDGHGPMTIAMPGMDHSPHEHHRGPDHPGKDMPCPFAGLTAPATAAADPVLLALALAFIVAVAAWFEAALPAIVTPFLRPPLRGPPLPSAA